MALLCVYRLAALMEMSYGQYNRDSIAPSEGKVTDDSQGQGQRHRAVKKLHII